MTKTTGNIYRQQPEEWIYDSSNYGKHVDRMTVESLHGKSDIAAELAWRDDQIEQLQQRNAELERERDELTAHFARIEDALEFIDKEFGGPHANSKTLISNIRDVFLRITPQQSLAEHDAEVIEKAAEELKYERDLESHSNVYKYEELVDYEELIDYANKIRNGDIND